MNIKKTVLIVEDKAEWIKILKSLLEEANFDCLTSTTYIEAINILQSIHPSAIILDLKLDNGNIIEVEWDGWQLAKVAKEQDIPSIIVSGHPRDYIFQRAYLEFNAKGFFDKAYFLERKSAFIECVQNAVKSTESSTTISPKVHPRKKRNSTTARPNRTTVTSGRKVKPSKVFISYSHKDRRWLDRFKINLKVLERAKKLDLWDDTRIESGAKWKDEIKNALTSAKVAVLLVTPEFLASDFINDEEIPVIFRTAKGRGLQIMWIAVKPSMYEETYICQFQAANDTSKPLSTMPKAKTDEEIIQICKKIKKAAA